MVHSFSLQSFNKIAKSFNILAFLEQHYRTIPIFLFEKPIYGVCFS